MGVEPDGGVIGIVDDERASRRRRTPRPAAALFIRDGVSGRLDLDPFELGPGMLPQPLNLSPSNAGRWPGLAPQSEHRYLVAGLAP